MLLGRLWQDFSKREAGLRPGEDGSGSAAVLSAGRPLPAAEVLG